MDCTTSAKRDGENKKLLIFLYLFWLAKHSPSLWRASCSNPRPYFSNCLQNDVMSVHRCLTTFRKKTIVYYCLIARYSTNKSTCFSNLFLSHQLYIRHSSGHSCLCFCLILQWVTSKEKNFLEWKPCHDSIVSKMNH